MWNAIGIFESDDCNDINATQNHAKQNLWWIDNDCDQGVDNDPVDGEVCIQIMMDGFAFDNAKQYGDDNGVQILEIVMTTILMCLQQVEICDGLTMIAPFNRCYDITFWTHNLPSMEMVTVTLANHFWLWNPPTAPVIMIVMMKIPTYHQIKKSVMEEITTVMA